MLIHDISTRLFRLLVSTLKVFPIALAGLMLMGNAALADAEVSHIEARWDPLHFKPAIETASNEQCLVCHQEILDRQPLPVTPAGVKASDTLAWYQTVDIYEGEQDSFHRRHLVSDMARELMDLKCNTCHQGHNANKQVSSESHIRYESPAIAKEVDPDICLLCHGDFDYEIMLGMAKPWEESREIFKNSCMVCHGLFRTNAHNVNYLKKEAIDRLGMENGETCYGCHGGRKWYRIAYPYPRNPWPGMSSVVPDWAKSRPIESQSRFLLGVKNAAEKKTKATEEEN